MDGSNENGAICDIRPLENEIAVTILKILGSGDYSAEAEHYMKHLFFQLFVRICDSLTYVPPLAILEGLVVLGRSEHKLSTTAIDFIIFLGSRSCDMWLYIMKPQLQKSIPKLSDAVLFTMAEKSPTFQEEQKALSKACVRALFDLSDIDKFDERRAIALYSYTPFIIVLKGFKHHLKNCASTTKCTQCELFESITKEIAPSTWVSITDSDIAVICQHFTTRKKPLDSLEQRLQYGFSRETKAFHQLFQVACSDNAPLVLKRWKRRQEQREIAFPCELKSDEQVKDSKTAFSYIRYYLENKQEEKIRSLVGSWLKEKNLDLVAAGYIAAPTVLNRMLSNNQHVMGKVTTSSLQMWSSIDDEFDAVVSELLRKIPEIGSIIPDNGQTFDKDPAIVIKRYALLFPYLLARRTACLASVVHTILQGLSDYKILHETVVLQVLQTILEVFKSLQCKNTDDAVKTCYDILVFVLGENRDTNGIPGNLDNLVILTCKILSQCSEVRQPQKIKFLLSKLQKNSSNSSNVRESATRLLDSHLELSRSKT